MATRTARPPAPAEDLSSLSDRQLMERMYREIRGDIGVLFELAENHAASINRVADAHEQTARRVDALITDKRAITADAAKMKAELKLAHTRVQELEKDVEPFRRARTTRAR